MTPAERTPTGCATRAGGGFTLHKGGTWDLFALDGQPRWRLHQRVHGSTVGRGEETFEPFERFAIQRDDAPDGLFILADDAVARRAAFIAATEHGDPDAWWALMVHLAHNAPEGVTGRQRIIEAVSGE